MSVRARVRTGTLPKFAVHVTETPFEPACRARRETRVTWPVAMSVRLTTLMRKLGRPRRLESWPTIAVCTCSTLAAVTAWPPTPPIVKEKMSSTSATGVEDGVCEGVEVMVDVEVEVAVAEAVAEAVDEAVAVPDAVEVDEDVEVAVAVPDAVCVGTTQMPSFVFAVEALTPPKAHTVQLAAPAEEYEPATH